MPIDVKCLLMTLPCVGELKGPEAKGICDILIDAVNSISDNSPETLQKINASLGSNPSISSFPSNVTASSPACKVDVIAQAKAASDALKEAKKFEAIISDTTEMVNEAISTATKISFSCPPLTSLLKQLYDYNSLVSQCQQATASTADFILSFELNFNFFSGFANLLSNTSFESMNLLQLLGNLGICNGALNAETAVKVVDGLVTQG